MKKLLSCLVLLTVSCSVVAEEGSDEECLTEALYFEARNQTPMQQLAVAQVIIDRVNDRRFPDSICGVVHHNRFPGVMNKCQFSYWCDGVAEVYANMRAYRTAHSLAKIAIDFNEPLRVVDCKTTHYIVTGTKVWWANKFPTRQEYGSHTFFCD